MMILIMLLLRIQTESYSRASTGNEQIEIENDVYGNSVGNGNDEHINVRWHR